MSDLKVCTKCGVGKALECFPKKSKLADGLNPSCRDCVSEASKAYYRSNAERVKARAKDWREKNIDRSKARAKERYDRSAETVKKRASIWASKNPERRKEIADASAAKHREKKNLANKAYRKLKSMFDPEGVRQENRMRASIRRSREVDNGISVTRGEWESLIDLFEFGTCLYCGSYGHKLTMDHWMPVKLGGRTEMGNLIPCCKSCNSRKGAKHPDEWKAIIGAVDAPDEGLTIEQFLECCRLDEGERAA